MKRMAPQHVGGVDGGDRQKGNMNDDMMTLSTRKVGAFPIPIDENRSTPHRMYTVEFVGTFLMVFCGVAVTATGFLTSKAT